MCVMLTGCDFKIIEQVKESNTEISSETTTTINSSSDDESWKTATLYEETTVTTPPPPEETQTTSTISITETTISDIEKETDISIDTLISNESETSDINDTKTSTTKKILNYSFDATVLAAERKYIIVKPDKKSEEFEISRKIVVYCSNAIDINVGDSVLIKYSGEFGPDKDDMPTIDDAECSIIKNGEDLPSFMTDNKKIEVEVIRVYEDGFLAKTTKDYPDFDENSKLNINIDDTNQIEKGQIITVEYKESPLTSEDDYPTIIPVEINIVSTPSYIVGTVSAINQNGFIVSFESGTIDAEKEADIIIVSDAITNISEGDNIKIYFEDDITSEPYIIYNVTSYNIN